MKRIVLFSLCLMACIHSFAYVSQGNWRWRNNNGSETSATWKAGENQTFILNSVNESVRLRLQLQNATGGEKDINTNLQYASAPDGPWRYITNFAGNNAFRFSNINSFVADTSATTKQLSDTQNSFYPGKLFVKTNELTIPLPNAVTSEYEYSLQPTENIQPSTMYYFRVPNSDYPVALPSVTTAANITPKKEILSNGSFERNPKEWVFKVAGNASAKATLVDSVHKEGLKSLFVNVTQPGSATSVRVSHKPFSLNVGHVYMVRFWAYAKKNSAKLQLAIRGTKTLPYSYKLYTGWQEYQFAFKAEEPTVALHFLFQTATSYTIDKVEILDENNEEVDVPMNYMWQNNRPENEYSWLSADGENSELLPDGRTVWTFSDGWYGFNDTTTNSMSTQQLLRNTFVTQSAPKPNGVLHTTIGGTVAQPQALMIPPDKRGVDNFFWPRDLTIENDSLKILLPEVVQWNSGDPLTDGHRQAVGVFSLPDLTLQSIQWMPWLDSVKPNYIALCKADDGFTYAYGSNAINQFENHAVVARFPTGKLSAAYPWQFLTDTGWSANQSNSKEIADVQLYSVARLGYHNYVSLFLNPLSDKVEVLYAENPVGPWVGRSIVGQLEGQDGILSYFGLLHEETEHNGVYTFSYSNIGDIPQMLDDKTVYWPTYLKADLRSLSPFNNNAPLRDEIHFVANQKGEQALLQWKWKAEASADHFEVEKSADGVRNWKQIAFVKANGKKISDLFELADPSLLEGNNYYRIKRVDVTGKSAMSDIQLVSLSSASAAVYPNPSHGSIHVIINTKENDKVTAMLSDVSGTIVHTEILSVTASNNRYQLHISKQLAAGIYNLQLKGKTLKTNIKVEVQ